MAIIKGYAVHAAGAEPLPYKYEPGELHENEIEVAVTHCALGRRDANLIDNDGNGSQYPFIPGHEIIGTVSAVGAKVKNFAVGDRVGVGWQAGSCGECEWCLKGEENFCAFATFTCVHRNGGLADRVRIHSRFAFPIPVSLESDTATPLLAAGVTAYASLRAFNVGSTTRVGVVGIGALGHLALQFARALGAEVTAFSNSADKEADAHAFGAHHFVNSRESKSITKLAGAFDLILSTAAGDQEWGAFIQALRPHGTLCFAGAPTKPLSIAAINLVSPARQVAGSNFGSPAKIREMLTFSAHHGISARIERFRMSEANQALKRIRTNQVRYRAVVENG